MTEIILAIDPGSIQSAWVLWDTGRKQIVDFGIIPNVEMVEHLVSSDVIYGNHLAIEMVASYGMPVGKDVFETVRWIGHFERAWTGDSTLVYRKEIKMFLCNSMRAKDSNIRQALIDRFPATGGGKTPQVGTKKNQGPLYGVKADIWSALAVAITFSGRMSDAET